MLETILVQLGFWALCAVGIALMLWRMGQRMDARSQAFLDSLRSYSPPRLDLPAPELHVETGLSSAAQEVVRSPSPALERALAALDSAAEGGAIDGGSEPSVPIDLGGLADRLSEAGYDGGALRLTGVEIRPDRHVVVHLEPQRP